MTTPRLIDVAVDLLRAQTDPGRFHYADLAALMAERDPSRFAPTPNRVTPHYTLWRTLGETPDFERLGDGWFWYRPWGPATNQKLVLSNDGGKALRAQSRSIGGRRPLQTPGTSAPGPTWVPFLEAFANNIAEHRERQDDLIAMLEELRRNGHPVTPLSDKRADGSRDLMSEIDPFTFLGAFCRGISDASRVEMMEAAAELLGVTADLPRDFLGLSLLNNQSSWFISYAAKRDPADVSKLWDVFRLALGTAPLDDPAFAEAFDRALTVRGTNVNLTMGLSWIRPRSFLPLDRAMRAYLGISLPAKGLTFAFFKATIDAVRARDGTSFVEQSLRARLTTDAPTDPPPAPNVQGGSDWLVGAYWDGVTPPDQTDRFLEQGIWENGYSDRFLDEVRAMKVGDRIAIKATTTQKHGLPFDARGQTVSKMTIKAVGTIVKNHGDGRVVEVEWGGPTAPRDWYFYTGLQTIWKLRDDEMARRLAAFVWNGESQEIAWFAAKKNLVQDARSYGVDDVLAEGVFAERRELEQALRRLETKKNLILQGAPGTGKSFIAPKLAYALMGEKDRDRVESLMFHPSTSYEDVVRGLRPGTVPGSFEIRDGPLWRFADRARADPDRRFVLVIDEINRGNLAQVFGECLQLLEADRRGVDHGVTPLHTRVPGERFWLPGNLFLIGTMNIADRSLALVDFALRRRFAFLTLEPQYRSPQFHKWMTARKLPPLLLQRITSAMDALNTMIAEDRTLGESFRVGHSFFCPSGDDFSTLDDDWMNDIVETELRPLLHEYWYDDLQKAEEAMQLLRPA